MSKVFFGLMALLTLSLLSTINRPLKENNIVQLAIQTVKIQADLSNFSCFNASTSSETVFSGSPTTTKSTSAFNRQSSGRDEGCNPNRITLMFLFTFFAMDATSNAVLDQPENGISNATTSGFHASMRWAMVSALNPTRTWLRQAPEDSPSPQ